MPAAGAETGQDLRQEGLPQEQEGGRRQLSVFPFQAFLHS